MADDDSSSPAAAAPAAAAVRAVPAEPERKAGEDDGFRVKSEREWQAEVARLEARVLQEREVCGQLVAMLQGAGIEVSLEDLARGIAVQVTQQRSFSRDPAGALDEGLAAYLQQVTEMLELDHDVDSVVIKYQDVGYDVEVEVAEGGGSHITTVGNLWRQLPCFKRGNVKRTTRHVLQGWTGVLKPGEMTLVLGPPGSGKSSLLKALASQLRQSDTRHVRGTVTYDGLRAHDEFVPQRILSYVPQIDTHLPTLTVRETFEFASRCLQGTTEQVLQRADGAKMTPEARERLARFVENKQDVLLQLLGLKRVEHTVVGDGMLRGVSGGEKKRVTSGEMLTGMQLAWFLDEVSTGLDSAATFDIMQTMKTAGKFLHGLCVVSLLQPPPEVYALFDNVIVIAEGQCVFSGPRAELMPFFEGLGYRCPERKDVADFIVEVTTPDGRRYLRDDAPADAPTTPAGFAAAFRESPVFAQARADLTLAEKEATWLSFATEEFALSWTGALRALLQRDVKLKSRDKAFVYGRFAQSAVMALMVGSLFYDLETDDYASRYGLFFFVAMTLSLGAMAAMPQLCEQRAVYYKQRRAGFFPTSTFVLSETMTNWPLAVAEVLLFGTIVYYLCGLTTSGPEILVFYFVSLCISLTMSQLFKTVTAVVPDAASAQPVAGVLVILAVLNSGFVCNVDAIPAGWIWMYYLSPLSWVMRAYAINEFQSDKYQDDVVAGAGGATRGDLYLGAYGYDDEDSNQPSYIAVCCLVLIAEYVVILAVNIAALYFIRWDGSGGGMVPDNDGDDVVEAAAPQAGGGGGDGSNGAHALDPVPMHQIGSALSAEAPPPVEALPFERVTLSFRALDYSVDLPRSMGQLGQRAEQLTLLHGVSGFARPGTMTALMGSSGAGKTTLLDVLAGRKTGGHISGDILVNGFPKQDAVFNRVAGYVEQFDTISPMVTVQEALEFSAALRLPAAATPEQRRQSVAQTLELLELTPIADHVVGLVGAAGALSTEQRKRVSIGLELVANPSIIFLDEPTSGLDARAAQVVMRAVRRIASTGRSVICTIHQPSAALFYMFDSLLLLKRGGHTVFFGQLGEEASALLRYLQAVDGVPPIEAGANPATYMLDVIGAGVGKGGDDVDFAREYRRSHLCEINMEELERVSQPGNEVRFKSVYARSLPDQMFHVTRRAFTIYWRSPSYSAVRLAMAAIIALIFGSMYAGLKVDAFSDVISLTAVMFIALVFVGIVQVITSVPVLSAERAVFYREKAINMYTPFAYAFGFGAAEVPYIVAVSSVFVFIFYHIVGLNDDGAALAWFWAVFVCYVAVCTYMGQMLVFGLPNQQTAQILAGASGSIYTMFSGFLIATNQMPDGWLFMTILCPAKYAFEALVTTQFHGDDRDIAGFFGTTTPEQFSAASYPDMDYDNRWDNLGALLAFVALFRVGTFLCMQFVNHANR